MAKKLGSSIRQVLLFGVIAGWIPLAYLCSCSPSPVVRSPRDSLRRTPVGETALGGDNVSAQFDETNPLGANAACYVCHMTFVKEELSKTHLRAEITCVRCHGLSAGHANDEDIGATPPDVSFKRDQVNVMCLKCHESHDIPSEEVVAGEHPSVCTDCHSTHKINRITCCAKCAARREGVKL